MFYVRAVIARASAQAFSKNAGFKEIYNVTGGTKAWMDPGLDTEVSATSCANSKEEKKTAGILLDIPVIYL